MIIKRKKFDETAVLKKNYNNIKRRDEDRIKEEWKPHSAKEWNDIPKKEVQESIALARSKNFSLKLELKKKKKKWWLKFQDILKRRKVEETLIIEHLHSRGSE